MNPPSEKLPMRRWLALVQRPAAARVLIGVVGLALLALGVGKAGATPGNTGALTLVVVGAVLLVIPFVLDRIQRVSVSATSFDVLFAAQVSDLGVPKTAAILQRSMLGSFAESYALVHDELIGPNYRGARIHLKDLLVGRAAGIARREKCDPVEVRTLFAKGSLVMRVLALGMMQGDRSLADISTIVAAIEDGLSSNEQYQGLQLATLCWPRLSTSDRQKIHRTIRQADLGHDTDRSRKAEAVLSLPAS